MRGYFGIGAEGISKPMNLGNLIRSAHAFGARFVFLIDAHHTVSSAPSDTSQTPHPVLPGFGTPTNTPTAIDYHEGAEVGYRWLARTGDEPLCVNQTNPTAAAIRAAKANRAIARTRAARHAGATPTPYTSGACRDRCPAPAHPRFRTQHRIDHGERPSLPRPL
jgi:hypothetical protein